MDCRRTITTVSLIAGAIAMIGMTPTFGAGEVKGWPEEVQTVEYPASIDGSLQPMLVYSATSKEKRPLLVGLHTWSGDYKQAGGEAVYARWCIENDWHFIHPHFRGPNKTPDACGSEKVVQDILDAVQYMKTHYNVDENRIYLVGVSGGGYAALLMAGRAPDVWAGVSAWAPISDIHAWWQQKDTGKQSGYARHIENAVGGRPDENKEAMQECIKRSPVTYLQNAAGVNLDINAGITDGHKGGSVPFTHSLYAFNTVVPEKAHIDPAQIVEFYERQALPAGLEKAEKDPLYGEKQVIFRNVHKNTRVSIFQGRHEIIHHAALNWLARQRKDKPAKWNVAAETAIQTNENESESGK
jgi:pimeloyl-ACP methyl ester carboxylesterase